MSSVSEWGSTRELKQWRRPQRQRQKWIYIVPWYFAIVYIYTVCLLVSELAREGTISKYPNLQASGLKTFLLQTWNDSITNIVGQSGPLRTNTNSFFGQSELEAKTCNHHQARENVQPVKKGGKSSKRRQARKNMQLVKKPGNLVREKLVQAMLQFLFRIW